ncbi:MAG TPA: PilN domain-containing protein [Vicinamibacterales bacterium]|nr:PilN domain-containing protein [Vicinamibacterales bacterium]
MIRINLLAVERGAAKKPRAAVTSAQRVTIGAALILLATLVTVGWWFWSLRATSARLDDEIARAETEAKALRSVLAEVQKFETRKATLQQRVTLIEQLRRGQSAPVHVLDEVSRAIPDRLWLVGMSQRAADFTLDGRTTSLTALSDFVGNLESSTWFKRPVEIIDSQVDHTGQGDLVRFTIRATSQNPEAPPPPPPAGRGAPPAR